MGNQSSGFPTTSDTNHAVQPQKMARGWKFRIWKEGLYYLCSENKGADQLHSVQLICIFVFAYAKPEDQWSCKRSPDILA